jgi:hypothetical protein
LPAIGENIVFDFSLFRPYDTMEKNRRKTLTAPKIGLLFREKGRILSGMPGKKGQPDEISAAYLL